MTVSGSTYPTRNGPQPLINLGGLTGKPDSISPATQATEDPGARSGAVLGMMAGWKPIDICMGGTDYLRENAEDIIYREPKEEDDAFKRRVSHAVMPPFLHRLASQAAGTVLRKGIHLEGGDEDYWKDWQKDVTGDGTPLNVYAREMLVDALLYGHTSCLVDWPDGEQPNNLAEELAMGRKPYLVRIPATQIRGWRTAGNRNQAPLTMVRYHETISVPVDQFGEEIVDQIRVLTNSGYQLWRDENPTNANKGGWTLFQSGSHTAGEVPLVTIYSNRIATLVSKPPLEEVANMCISYAQRFCDYYHSIHVGAMPILCLKGFDPDSNETDLGLSVNTAVLLPPEGDCMIVSPPADSYQEQLKCLTVLEEQISALGISALAKQNLTNTAAESKRLDRIDSDSIMSIISEDLARAISDMLRIAGKYAGKEPPTVSIPKDYENRLLDGNQITAMLQLQMQNQISQSTLLTILKEGEILPPYVDIDKEILRTKDAMEEQFDLQLEQSEAQMQMQMDNTPNETEGGVSSGGAASGSTKGAGTLPTPLRPGKHSE